MVNSDKEISWIRFSGRYIIRDNKPVQLIGLYLDLNAFKNAENSLQNYRSLLQSIVTNRTKDLSEAIRKLQREIDIHKNSEDSLSAYSQHLQDIREKERTLISREIHDQLGQLLTALKIDLSQFQEQYSRGTENNRKIEGMVEIVSKIISDVQRISSELRPAMLDDIGLNATLEWTCQEFETRTGIKCEFKNDDSELTDEKINLAAFRIVQEALTNIIRHANAKKVLVNIYRENDLLVLKIDDDGQGLSDEKIFAPKSLGLIGMKERAKQFKGDFQISSIKDKGTCVRVTIPI